MLNKSVCDIDFSGLSSCDYNNDAINQYDEVLIYGCECINTKHSHITYNNITINYCNFMDSIFSNVTFEHSTILNSSFCNTIIINSYFNETMSGCSFNYAELVNTRFNHATVTDCTFEEARINNVLFSALTYESDDPAIALAVLSSDISRKTKRAITVPSVTDVEAMGILLQLAGMCSLKETNQFKIAYKVMGAINS